MKRNIAIIVGLVVVIGAAIGGFVLLNDSPSEPALNDKEGYGEARAENDPGPSVYKHTVNGEEKTVIDSTVMADRFYESYMSWRTDKGKDKIFQDVMTLRSVARTHSAHMKDNSYLKPVKPSGPEPSAEYQGTMATCDKMTRVVRKSSHTLVRADGTTTATSASVASEIFGEMINDTERVQTLKKDYEALGTGFYFTTSEQANGSVVAEVYMTIDLCKEFTHDRWNS